MNIRDRGEVDWLWHDRVVKLGKERQGKGRRVGERLKRIFGLILGCMCIPNLNAPFIASPLTF